MTAKLLLKYQLVALLASPLIGWVLAKLDVSDISALCIISAIALWPLVAFAYLEVRGLP